ncbi:MAG: hypothetical protein OXG92_09250 [Chloroflexi bacterium]|nr:hypothetical protein [Chloroflexota bacterium]MCY3581004.1 hypothetical protein [Chloroflexota bacterium]MCY3716633.1 hypothetical protein [Chloroflexota bacterium]MDE2650496.1 hypothetical protein [Chloroflexota bacterium]MXV92408.1 hypothetical protein [Chloroflexota bacterium]
MPHSFQRDLPKLPDGIVFRQLPNHASIFLRDGKRGFIPVNVLDVAVGTADDGWWVGLIPASMRRSRPSPSPLE